MLREGEARGKRLAVYCLCDLHQPYQRQPRPVQCWVAHPTAHTSRSTAKPHESARCQRHVRCESELRGGAAPQSADVSRPFPWRHATPRGGARSWADAGSCVYLVAPDTPHAGLDATAQPLSRSLSTNSRLPPTPKPRTATGLRLLHLHHRAWAAAVPPYTYSNTTRNNYASGCAVPTDTVCQAGVVCVSTRFAAHCFERATIKVPRPETRLMSSVRSQCMLLW